MTTFSLSAQKKLLTRRRSGWIGIDIGADALKLAQVERSGTEWKISGSLILPTGGGRLSAGNLTSNGWIAELVQSALMDGSAFRGRQAACLLSMSVADLRMLELPTGSESELREMIAQELAADSDIDADDMEFDFWESGLSKNKEQSGTTQLGVLSVSRRLSQQVAVNLLHSGLKCRAIDGLPFALARAVGMADADAAETPVAALDWGYSTATVTFIANGSPLFTRQLRNCGYGQLLESLGGQLDLSERECARLLRAAGFASSENEPGRVGLKQMIDQITAESIDRIAAELDRTFKYFRQQQSAFFPKKLWLFGGGATAGNVASLFASKIGMPTEVWQLPTNSTFATDRTNPETALLGPAASLSALAFES